MRHETWFTYAGTDATPLAGVRWECDMSPRAVVQIAHGAAEHSGRYRERFAKLVKRGFVVYSGDHRGHGRSALPGKLGDFGPDGAKACVADMVALSRILRASHPGLPLVLFGHSMGAAFAQSYLIDHSDLIDALVLSGTADPRCPRPTTWSGSVNEPNSRYAWLSTDVDQVAAYARDPLCGFSFSKEAEQSLSDLYHAIPNDRFKSVRSTLPVLIFAGWEDPVNQHLSRLTPLVAEMGRSALAVDMFVYGGGRHEMLNEVQRENVIADLIVWLETRMALRPLPRSS